MSYLIGKVRSQKLKTRNQRPQLPALRSKLSSWSLLTKINKKYRSCVRSQRKLMLNTIFQNEQFHHIQKHKFKRETGYRAVSLPSLSPPPTQSPKQKQISSQQIRGLRKKYGKLLQSIFPVERQFYKQLKSLDQIAISK